MNLILFHSKFSKHCQNFLSLLDNSNLQFPINLICIDNQNTRKQIRQSKNIEIDKVPCLLIIYPQNKIEKFEGNDAFFWLTNYINEKKKLQPPSIQQPQPLPPSSPPTQSQIQQPLPPSLTSSGGSSSSGFTSIDNINENIQENEIIDDSFLNDDNDDNDNMDLSLNMGNHNISPLDENEKLFQTMAESNGSNLSVVKKIEKTKRNSIFSAAMEMQKNREVEESSNQRKNPNQQKFLK